MRDDAPPRGVALPVGAGFRWDRAEPTRRTKCCHFTRGGPVFGFSYGGERVLCVRVAANDAPVVHDVAVRYGVVSKEGKIVFLFCLVLPFLSLRRHNVAIFLSLGHRSRLRRKRVRALARVRLARSDGRHIQERESTNDATRWDCLLLLRNRSPGSEDIARYVNKAHCYVYTKAKGCKCTNARNLRFRVYAILSTTLDIEVENQQFCIFCPVSAANCANKFFVTTLHSPYNAT